MGNSSVLPILYFRPPLPFLSLKNAGHYIENMSKARGGTARALGSLGKMVFLLDAFLCFMTA